MPIRTQSCSVTAYQHLNFTVDNALNMALSVYDAVISSYEDSGGALADAWAIAEQQGQEDREKNKLKLYAALLVDDEASNVKEGYLVLGGRLSGARLMIIDERPANIPTSLWGDYGWSTWCYTLEDVIKEAIASNSRGPTQEVAKQSFIHWLIMELDIQLCKLPDLLMKRPCHNRQRKEQHLFPSTAWEHPW